MAMDFSTNYTCSHGREIQLFNCNQCQITLHPMMLYYTKDDELRKEDYTAITDDLKHVAGAVSELKGAALLPETVIFSILGHACRYINSLNK